MRLLERNDNGNVYLTEYLGGKVPPYAVLSHTWGPDEVTFKDMMNGTNENKPGYDKIRFCGQQASRHGLKHFWVDTCCIDKSNSQELQEAITSMFRWYHDATKCYAYLADVSTSKHTVVDRSNWEPSFRASRWFTRGWTLQELIAPESIEFFSNEGLYLGNKISLEETIHQITGIPLEALRGSPLSDFSIAERLAWMDKRKTSRKEDRAYSLIGILDVAMVLMYGEGEDKAFQRLQDEVTKEDRCLAMLASTDPRHDKIRIEASKGGLLADAYQWILENQDFQLWRSQGESRLLWIKGDPGKGKTMLLCGIIDELAAVFLPQGNCNLAYFFCQATDSRINSATAVLRGLIYLLIRQQRSLRSYLKEYINTGKSLVDADSNTWVALVEILQGILEDPNIKDTYLVIDALDECVVDLTQLLGFIASISSDRVKWLVSSRNERGIEKTLKPNDGRAWLSLELTANAEQISHAVNIYIDKKLSDLNVLQEDDDSEIKDRIWDIEDIVQEMPSGLDGMYNRMMGKIRQQHRRDITRCLHILSTAMLAHRPLHLAEIGGLSGLPGNIIKSTENVRIVVAKCGSFLTVRDDQVYLIHQSAKDFLVTKGSNLLFPDGYVKIHHDIASRSLKLMSETLRRNVYDVSSPASSIDQILVPKPDPLASVRYSCVFWVKHLHGSICENGELGQLLQEDGAVSKFLRTRFLYWLEALSLLRSIPEGVLAIRQLQHLLGNENIPRLQNFAQDMSRFALSYRSIIEQVPLQAYTSGLLFAPDSSLVKKEFKVDGPNWISMRPSAEEEWNACLQTLEGHNDRVTSVTFSHDSQRLASGSHDSTVKIWDIASGTCVQTLVGHHDYVLSIAFSHDSQRLASGSDDATVKIWDTVLGIYIMTFEGHKKRVSSVSFSHDDKRLASGSYDSTVKIWDMASGTCLQTLKDHHEPVLSVSFSNYGQLLASGSRGGTVKIWNASTYVQTFESYDDDMVSSVAFSRNSEQFAVGSHDTTVKIRDTVSGRCKHILEGHCASVWTVEFSHDSRRLASGANDIWSNDIAIKIWDTSSGTCIQSLEGHSAPVFSVAFSHDSQQLVSGSDDASVKIWDIYDGKCIPKLQGHRSSVSVVTSSHDSGRLVSGSSKIRSNDTTVKIWDTDSGICVQTLGDNPSSVSSMVFSHDDRYLASGFNDTTIKVWDIALGVCIHTLEGHDAAVSSVAFSHNDQQLASGSHDTTIMIWHMASEKCITILEGHRGTVLSVSFSHDSQQLASASFDTNVKVWDVALGICIRTFKGYHGPIWSVAFSNDSQKLASGSRDSTVQIWDTTSGTCVRTINVATLVTSISFDCSSCCLLTNIGRIELDTSATMDSTIPLSQAVWKGCGLGWDKSWITWNGLNAIWLPPEYRPTCSIIHGQMISVGCASGRAFTFHFLRPM